MKREMKKCLGIMLVAGMLCFGCAEEEEGVLEGTVVMNENIQQVLTKELGETMSVDQIMSLTLEEGGFYDEGFYPYYGNQNSSCIKPEDGETIFGLYGVVENLASQKYNLNDIVDIKVLIDGQYEYSGVLYLETEDRTDFVADWGWFEDEIQPKANRDCVLVSRVGSEVAAEATNIKLTIDIYEDAEKNEESQRFVIELEIERTEASDYTTSGLSYDIYEDVINGMVYSNYEGQLTDSNGQVIAEYSYIEILDNGCLYDTMGENLMEGLFVSAGGKIIYEEPAEVY